MTYTTFKTKNRQVIEVRSGEQYISFLSLASQQWLTGRYPWWAWSTMNSWYNPLLIFVPTSVHLCDLKVQVLNHVWYYYSCFLPLSNFVSMTSGVTFFPWCINCPSNTQRELPWCPTQTMKIFLEYKVSLSLALYYWRTKEDSWYTPKRKIKGHPLTLSAFLTKYTLSVP